MNTTHSAFARAAFLFALCVSAAACPGSDGATGPQNAGGDSLVTPAEDRTAPTVTATRPAGEAANVATDAVIEVDFSEAIDPASITRESFKVGAIVGTVSVSGRTARFQANAALPPGLRHAAVLTKQVRDIAGNALVQDYTWAFTTSNPAPPFAPLPLFAGKAWRYQVTDAGSYCTRSGCSVRNFEGHAYLHVEQEVSWEGRAAWRVMEYRVPTNASTTVVGLSVRTSYVAQATNALLRWHNGAWRTVLPSSGPSFPSGSFFVVGGPTEPGTSTIAAATVTVPGGTFATTRVQHDFRQNDDYDVEHIYETRTEHYAANVGLVRGSWSYSRDPKDPAASEESSNGTYALAANSSLPGFGAEAEPNNAQSAANPMQVDFMSGTTLMSDAGVTLTDAEVGCTQVCIMPNVGGQKRIQDWYRISLGFAAGLRVELVFDEISSGATNRNDLDLYLFQDTPAGLRFVASSLNEPGKFELLRRSLTPGTYYVAVQAWETPAAPVRYWLYRYIDK